MKISIDFNLLVEYIRSVRAVKAAEKAITDELKALNKNLETAKKERKAVQKRIAERFPSIDRGVKAIVDIGVEIKTVETSYSYPVVTVAPRADAIVNANKQPDDADIKTALKIIKELKKSA